MQGKAVYHVYCERCHGTERQGAPPAIPSLVNAPTVFGAKTIKGVVNYGLNDMPAFPDLTDHLLDNLLLYLGNPASAPEPIPSRNEPPPASSATASEPVRYWSGYGLQPSIIRPPWTVMTAYDLNRGVIQWQVPLGNAPQGASENLKDTGIMMSRNGPVVTATGLIFIATKDEGKLRAYDEQSGKVLWETDLPAASEGVPAIYEVDGHEYLVVCAASAKQTDIPRDGPEEQSAQTVHRSYIAFALPQGRNAN
jgi:quinoprotein glucose dehydrogenase